MQIGGKIEKSRRRRDFSPILGVIYANLGVIYANFGPDFGNFKFLYIQIKNLHIMVYFKGPTRKSHFCYVI